MHVDQVIPAIGQVINPNGLEFLLEGENHLQVDQFGQIRRHAGLFAGGDAANQGGGTVTAAVGDGRRAAEAMSRYVKGEALHEQQQVTPIAYQQLNLNYFEPAKRNEQTILPVEERIGEEEIEAGLDANQVMAEARRCLSCGNCMACDNCWVLCPDSAVLKTRELAADGSHYVFDYDYCKGCGLCAHECPCGFIGMVKDM